MAKSARSLVFEGMELLPEALIPFVENKLEHKITGFWRREVLEKIRTLCIDSQGKIGWDQAALLNIINIFWKEAFKDNFSRSDRSLVNELAEVRNKLSHNGDFSYDDAERALDSMRRLMEAISAGEVAQTLANMRDMILRTKFAEQIRAVERRKTPQPQMNLDLPNIGNLLPWREVVEPHDDVTSGTFQLAEFAADLGKVHRGSGRHEYSNPQEFFTRTYLTGGLSRLLINAARRLSGQGGDPVVELQTNFGGGKTHSMLALYHMAGPIKAANLAGLDQLLQEENLTLPENIKRAVLVGTARSPRDIERPKQGIEICSTWGEIAWGIGGEAGFAMVAEHDRSGIAPGSNLLEDLFKRFGPALILIDEWVAYLRQIYKIDNLPSGSFDANLTFVQSLTEAVKACPHTLLVASLPASQIEVGGEGGDAALARLKQTFSRIESSWQPASQEESYEIVRRRLFKTIAGDNYKHRDNTVKQFTKLYTEHKNHFPRGVDEGDYKRKLELAYPIHPELFDQLYNSWGALEKFQRTRGVLRLMAQIIHELWLYEDKSTMIMPASVMLDSNRVEPELTRYLNDPWRAIIASDVDGRQAISHEIDVNSPNLGKYSITRRIARTLFMATAPFGQIAETRGIDDRQINLGSMQPGENPSLFSDALRRLAMQAKYLHMEGNRYWYDTNPGLNRMAIDRAERLEAAEIDSKLTEALQVYFKNLKIQHQQKFCDVHIAPLSGAQVPDEAGGVRLVVLDAHHPHILATARTAGTSPAIDEAREILDNANAGRIYRNTLIFLSPDQKSIENLRHSIRNFLAWRSILEEKDILDLTQSNERLAQDKEKEASETMLSCLRNAWCYLLCPKQDTPEVDIDWAIIKLSVGDNVIEAVNRRLEHDNQLLSSLGARTLYTQIERIWGDKPHLSLQKLWLYLQSFVYLPRLVNREVLVAAVRASVSQMLPGPFAYAEFYDESQDRYHGLLRAGQSNANIAFDAECVLIKADVAERHEVVMTSTHLPNSGQITMAPPIAEDMRSADTITTKVPPLPTRFYGSVNLTAHQVEREARTLAAEILEPILRQAQAEIDIKLEIIAHIPTGINATLKRTLNENAAQLKFTIKQID